MLTSTDLGILRSVAVSLGDSLSRGLDRSSRNLGKAMVFKDVYAVSRERLRSDDARLEAIEAVRGYAKTLEE